MLADSPDDSKQAPLHQKQANFNLHQVNVAHCQWHTVLETIMDAITSDRYSIRLCLCWKDTRLLGWRYLGLEWRSVLIDHSFDSVDDLNAKMLRQRGHSFARLFTWIANTNNHALILDSSSVEAINGHWDSQSESHLQRSLVPTTHHQDGSQFLTRWWFAHLTWHLTSSIACRYRLCKSCKCC